MNRVNPVKDRTAESMTPIPSTTRRLPSTVTVDTAALKAVVDLLWPEMWRRYLAHDADAESTFRALAKLNAAVQGLENP